MSQELKPPDTLIWDIVWEVVFGNDLFFLPYGIE